MMQKLQQYHSNPSICEEKDPINNFQTITYAAFEQNSELPQLFGKKSFFSILP